MSSEDPVVPDAEPSPLQGVRYGERETRLWRWVDAPADAAVTRFVEGYRNLGSGDERTTERRRLRAADCFTLVVFAGRCALAAIRTRDETFVAAAYDALSAVDPDRVDRRDVSWAAAVVGYAAQRLGRSSEALAAGPASRAHPDTAALLAECAAQQIDLVGDWGLREVDTDDGPVIMDSDDNAYAPDADLCGTAFRLADVFEADHYAVTGVSVACDIPGIWLDGREPEGVTGVVSVSADLRDAAEPPMSRDILLAFVIETRTPAQAAAIAASARQHGGVAACRLAVTSDRLCALLVARAVVLGRTPRESQATLLRFQERLRALVTP